MLTTVSCVSSSVSHTKLLESRGTEQSEPTQLSEHTHTPRDWQKQIQMVSSSVCFKFHIYFIWATNADVNISFKKVSSYYITSPSSFWYPTILRAHRSVAVWATITLWTLTDPSLTMGTTWTYWGPSFFLIRAVVTLPHPKWSVEALRFIWWDVGLKVDRDHTWSRKTTCSLSFNILHPIHTEGSIYIQYCLV